MTQRSGTALCVCGHSSDWHSHDGRGACEHAAECRCERFTLVAGAVRKLVALELPAGAIQLLYDVLGHYPFDQGQWWMVARANCSVALMDAREA